ncbi:hypothetical protein PVAP13_2NG499703 [Panicum virgatum]|uniref:Uncharacterized protein n=1 Tax=Panicum virgatum TaxID=38727 RepID=A0A8T0VRQ5_PANVG|nr:hypothetical protein PVAP13_2NG499703 [Panicum virgatum]
MDISCYHNLEAHLDSFHGTEERFELRRLTGEHRPTSSASATTTWCSPCGTRRRTRPWSGPAMVAANPSPRVRSAAAARAAAAPSLCARSAAGCLHGRLSHSSVHDFEYNHQILANLLDYSIEIDAFLLLQMVYNLQI